MTPTGNEKQSENSQTVQNQQPPAIGTERWVGIALVLVALLAAAALWVSTRSSKDNRYGLRLLNRKTETMAEDHSRIVNSLLDRFSQMQKQNADLRAELVVLNDKLEDAQGDAQAARNQVKKLRNQDREQINQLAAIDADVKEELAAKAALDDVKSVSSEVATVRSEIKAAKNTLQMTQTDMGTLIARNHDDIEILRRMGERDYFEFTITGKNASEKMGDIIITLRGTDPCKNECDLQLFVDDKRTEKRNRAINEPIFFYRQGARQPAEVVINQVAKNSVIGYLSVPREKQQLAIAGAN